MLATVDLTKTNKKQNEKSLFIKSLYTVKIIVENIAWLRLSIPKPTYIVILEANILPLNKKKYICAQKWSPCPPLLNLKNTRVLDLIGTRI